MSQTIGKIRVSVLYVSSEGKIIRYLKTVIAYIDRVSEYGLFHDLRIVGANPNISIVVRSMTEIIGCLATSHIGIASKARIKNITSMNLISFVPYLKLKIKIAKKIKVSTSVIQPPTPAPPSIWSENIIPVVIEKINQEKRWGLVLFLNISLK